MEMNASSPAAATRIPSIETRLPAKRLGVAVVEALVDVIVSGSLAPGDLLPPEVPLSRQFGVSRTVLRESVKRIEEKGLVTVAQGRGTRVEPSSSWNILDRVVLTSLIAHDDSLGVLDDLSVVRARLESAMAGDTAQHRTVDQLNDLRRTTEIMRISLGEPESFDGADHAFHEMVMAFSGNRLAESIARILFERARESIRYRGIASDVHVQLTLDEHEKVFAAIDEGDVEGAERAMNEHIIDAWQRRRLPDHRGARSTI
jgi:DNA-binding FadR family transcriptional regulator